MAAGLPITVIESFVLPEWEPAGWAGARETIRECALKHSSCRAFHILQDEPNSRHVLLISEWDSAETFNQFVRESGVLWLERGQHPEMRGTFSILERGVERVRRFSGAMLEESRAPSRPVRIEPELRSREEVPRLHKIASLEKATTAGAARN
jgi:Antibiotic biosynthesis monooxygenase